MCFILGMVAYQGLLYVAEQKMGAILTFDIMTEEHIGNIVKEKKHENQIEQITLSPC